MTETTTATPIAARRCSLPRLRLHLPRVRIASVFEPLFLFLGDAYSMVYAAPFHCHQPKKTSVPDEDLNGRDPSW